MTGAVVRRLLITGGLAAALAGCATPSSQSLDQGRYSGALGGVIPLNVQVQGSTVRVNGTDADLPDPTATDHFILRNELDMQCQPAEGGASIHCRATVLRHPLGIPCPTGQNCAAASGGGDVDLLKICSDPTCA